VPDLLSTDLEKGSLRMVKLSVRARRDFERNAKPVLR